MSPVYTKRMDLHLRNNLPWFMIRTKKAMEERKKIEFYFKISILPRDGISIPNYSGWMPRASQSLS
eukprot:3899266-Ditylum_brightwellii.AAC.1